HIPFATKVPTFMAQDSEEECSEIVTQYYHDYEIATQIFKTELYDPEECEEILEEEKSKILNEFENNLGSNEEDLKQKEILVTKIERLAETLKESNNTRFWFVQNALDECMDSALTYYRNNADKRFEDVSSLTFEDFMELQHTLESESLGVFDNKVSLTKNLPPTEVQISRHQLRKELDELVEDCGKKFKEEMQTQIQTAISTSEEKAKKIILDKINRYATQFDLVSERDFLTELNKIRKSTVKQIENEMFFENKYTEPAIFKIVDKLEASLHDFGVQYWQETLVYSNQEGEGRIRDKIQRIKEMYSENLCAKKVNQRKIFVQSERNTVMTEFADSFSFSDQEGEDSFKEFLESELSQVEKELGVKEDSNGFFVTELIKEQHL
ncbi:unnamed protein product, partial [Allacma fusca]